MAPTGSSGGNTKPPSSRPAASKFWCFTWNNYPNDYLAQLAQILERSQWIMGEEVGESGTPHIQGYIEFPDKVRPLGYKGTPKQIHWEKARGTCAENVAYCSKEGKVNPHSTLKPPRAIKFPVMDLWWELEIIDILANEPDDRTIHWYWSESGNMGKTTFTKYLAVKHNACILAGKGADVRNGALTWKKDKGAYPDVCVFPIPRSHNSEYISYEAIENVKDACFYSGKYEGGTVADACPHLIVFANSAPDETKMSDDRWHVVNIDVAPSNNAGNKRVKFN